MTTPVFLTGFENGVLPTTNGGGLWNGGVSGPTVMSIQGTIKNTGNYALRMNPNNVNCYVSRSISQGVVVGRAYVRWESFPTTNSYFLISDASDGDLCFEFLISTSSIRANKIGVGTAGSFVVSTGVWYRIDWKFDASSTTHTIDWQIDGVAQTQLSVAGASQNLISVLFGASGPKIQDMYLDDIVISATSGDYPIGPGGTEILVPSAADATNVGTNDIEESNGTDASSTSWQALNSIPMGNSTNYIRQLQSINTHYLRVSLTDLTASHSSIIGAMAILGYTSATATTNNGGCIVSKDSFTSYTTIWGDPTTPADYSDGSISNVYWKSTIVSGAVDDTTVNALEVEIGFSSDASPDPYWIDVAVEVAYAESTTDINLNLATYSTTIPDIIVLENVVVPLDLVIYSSTIPNVGFVENVDVFLDLVTYSNTIHDITLLENVVVFLDLVTYSSTIHNITVLENVVLALDLVSYSSIFPDVTVLENVILTLDLVIYSNTIADLTILETQLISLDLVTYFNTILDVELLEEGTIALDLVTYSFVIHNVTILEHVIEPLELVTFSQTVYNVTILEDEIHFLNLVTYTSTVHNVLFTSDSDTVVVPMERTYSLSKEVRIISIEKEVRIISIEKENRILSVSKDNRVFLIQ